MSVSGRLGDYDWWGFSDLHALYQMDKSLVFILVFLTIVAIIGLGIAFVGLAYHHHRRHHELFGTHAGATGMTTTTGAHT